MDIEANELASTTLGRQLGQILTEYDRADEPSRFMCRSPLRHDGCGSV